MPNRAASRCAKVVLPAPRGPESARMAPGRRCGRSQETICDQSATVRSENDFCISSYAIETCRRASHNDFLLSLPEVCSRGASAFGGDFPSEETFNLLFIDQILVSRPASSSCCDPRDATSKIPQPRSSPHCPCKILQRARTILLMERYSLTPPA